MYCPRDGKCVFDRFRVTGVHICALPRCQYPQEVIKALKKNIARYPNRTEYREELERFIQRGFKAGGDYGKAFNG